MKKKSILSFFLLLSLFLSFSRSCAVNKGIVYFLDNTWPNPKYKKRECMVAIE